jgi:hypothetical protein
MHKLEHLLQTELEPITRRYRQHRLTRRLAGAWATAGTLGILLFLFSAGLDWRWPWLVPLFAATTITIILCLRYRWQRDPIDTAWVVHTIEQEHPRLHALLLTAVEQHPDAQTGEFHYLQQRVIEEALAYNRLHPWGSRSFEALFFAQCAHRGAQIVFVLALAGLYLLAPVGSPSPPDPSPALTVTPGDASIERGQNLVILAHFADQVPPEATLVSTSSGGTETRVPLARNLDDPIFGGSILSLTNDLTYHVAYGDARSQNYRVTVFDYPRLDRADARLTYPAYTGLEVRSVDDTRRVTAVEGTRLEYTLHFNKPIVAAHWTAPDDSTLFLEPDPERPQIAHLTLPLQASGRYGLIAFDDAGRTNRTATEFVIEVFTNRTPELKLISPRGDDRASALEEIVFRGQVSDDFGVQDYGIAFQWKGQDPRFIGLSSSTAPHEQKEFQHLLPLEDLQATRGQLLSYFLWADDLGPDGATRRTFSDLYFIEIRPFDEIFREGQSGAGQGGGQQPDSPGEQLAELQKQIISATWQLQRRSATRLPEGFAEDASVIRQSQHHALEQVAELAQQSTDPNASTFLAAAETEMGLALQHLEEAARDPSADPLAVALTAEQSAYEALLQLQAHEYQVARSQQGGAGQGSRGRAQRQLDQLQLKEAENRYQTQSQASAPTTEAQRQQLEFLARLRELAQRQQDLNQQLQELQLALQEANSPEEREDLARRLKRLQDEQRQMLADVDELQQRMEQSGQPPQTADARQQLDQARSNLQRAAEALNQGAVSDALASGTRGSRQLEQIRDELRSQSSSQFADQMRRMRDDAKQLLDRHQALANEMQTLTQSTRPTLSDTAQRQDLAHQMAGQTTAFSDLLDQLRQVSEQSEQPEPLLSRQLHETYREIRQADASYPRQLLQELLQQGVLTRPVLDLLRSHESNDPGQSLQLSEQFLRDGHLTAAQHLEPKVRSNLERLSDNIERATQSILGDETQAMRLARAELDGLLADLEREMAAAQPRPTSSAPDNSGSPSPSAPSDSPSRSDPSPRPESSPGP